MGRFTDKTGAESLTKLPAQFSAHFPAKFWAMFPTNCPADFWLNLQLWFGSVLDQH